MRTILLSLFAVGLYGQTAGQPLTCFSNSYVAPPVLRAEGYSELAGDVVISCVGGNPAAPFLTTIQVFVNTQITSRLLSSEPAVSEALLMIDEPGLQRLDDTGDPSQLTTPFCVSPNAASNPTATGVSCNPVKPGVTYQQGTYTVFRAQRATGDDAESSLIWSGIPVTPPGQNRMRNFRISNLRVNAAALGASSTLIPTQVSAFVSISPSGALPIYDPQQTIGYVQNGLLFDVRTCNGQTPSPESLVHRQCSASDVQRQFYDRPDTAGILPAAGSFRFREAHGSAFMPQIREGQSQAEVGNVYSSESGFVRPESGVSGVADSGTRLAVRFSGVPQGVRIFVSAREAAGSTTVSRAVLVASSPDGAPRCWDATATRFRLWKFPITQGAGLAVWEVTEENRMVHETFLFTYGVAYRDNRAEALPAVFGATGTGRVAEGEPSTVGSGLVSGMLAPFYKADALSTGMQGLSVAAPRFRTIETLSEALRISGCNANTVVVNFTSNLSGSEVLVDGVAYSTPKSFAWNKGDTHKIDVVGVQNLQAGVRRVFTGWSNGGRKVRPLRCRTTL